MPPKPLLGIILTLLDNIYFEIALVLVLVAVRSVYLRHRKAHPLPAQEPTPRDPAFEKIVAGLAVAVLLVLHFNLAGMMLAMVGGIIAYVVLQQLWEGYRKTHPLPTSEPVYRDIFFEMIVLALIIGILVFINQGLFAVTFGGVLFIVAYWGLRALWERLRRPRQAPAPPAVVPKQKDFALEMIDTLLIAVVLVFGIVRHFLLQTYFIPSPSMEPTLLGPRPPAAAASMVEQRRGLDYLLHGGDSGARGGDKLFANRFIYRVRPPHRGDVVVFRPPVEAIAGNNPSLMMRAYLEAHPDALTPEEASIARWYLTLLSKSNGLNPGALDQPGKFAKGNDLLHLLPSPPSPMWRDDYIKRVIGVPGDHIRVTAGEGVFINGTRLDEPYLPNGESASTISFPTTPADPGPAPRLQIGEAGVTEHAMQAYLNAFFGGETLPGTYQAGWLQQWYTFEMLHNRRIAPYLEGDDFVVPADHFFVMGDNRNDSMSFDSRYWGLVPAEDARARAVSTFWPLDRLKLL